MPCRCSFGMERSPANLPSNVICRSNCKPAPPIGRDWSPLTNKLGRVMADNATVLRLNEVDSEDVSSSGKFMPPVFRPGFSIGNLPSRHPQLSRLETMPHCKILWPSPPPQLSLEQSAPHVWAARLDVPAAARANFASTLSPLET